MCYVILNGIYWIGLNNILWISTANGWKYWPHCGRSNVDYSLFAWISSHYNLWHPLQHSYFFFVSDCFINSNLQISSLNDTILEHWKSTASVFFKANLNAAESFWILRQFFYGLSVKTFAIVLLATPRHLCHHHFRRVDIILIPGRGKCTVKVLTNLFYDSLKR